MKISTAFALVVLTALAVFAQVETLSLNPPVFMPDGTEFKTWENTTSYTTTYVVDQHHPIASDDNPGTADKPFKTINKAAQVLQAGERVIIKSGVYREKIVPKNGGSGADKMISYEAAPGANVVIKGSRLLEPKWQPSRNPAQFSEKLWMITMPAALFPEENPFALENASAADIEIMPWATEWTGRSPYTQKRGLVFQDGRRLTQLSTYEDLPRLPGSYWVAPNFLTLHIHPFDGVNPNQNEMEVTVQQQLFKPDVTDLGYIRVSGLNFAHAGNGLPRTGVGALFTMGGHHWIIENNTFTDIHSVAVEIGTRSLESPDRDLSRRDGQRARTSPGYVIVRNNEFSECGRGGVQGLAVRRALVEDNHFHHIGWMDVERYWECGAIKLLINENTLVRRNLIHDVMAGSAVWLDWDNQYSRITQNTIYDVQMCCNGALYIEASRSANMIDHNILLNIHGVAICCQDSDSLLIAHNLVSGCTGWGVLSAISTDRTLRGRQMTSKDNRVVNNIFATAQPIFFQDEANLFDHNVFSAGIKLPANAAIGKNNQAMELTFDLDRSAIELSVAIDGKVATAPVLHFNTVDFYNSPRGQSVVPGPFEEGFIHLLKIDPRTNNN